MESWFYGANRIMANSFFYLPGCETKLSKMGNWWESVDSNQKSFGGKQKLSNEIRIRLQVKLFP